MRLAVGLLLLGVLATPATVTAHDFLPDDTRHVEILLHIDPDDTPVAGKQSTLHYDLDVLTPTAAEVQATIGGKTTQLKPQLTAHMVMAQYTFPKGGTYQLVLHLTTGGKTYIFRHDQVVAAAPQKHGAPGWMIALGVVGLVAVVTLGQFGFRALKKTSP